MWGFVLPYTNADSILLAMNQKSLFIVLYGINNLGKTTQAKRLVEQLNKEGHPAQYLKYPIYDLEPSGPLINAYLRGGNPYALSPREAQLLYVLNRTQAEPAIKKKLKEGISVVAEDYIGTGLAWGIGAGVDETFMKKINTHLVREDISFLFEGTRYTDATEGTHKHETDDALLQTVQDVHKKLGGEYEWISVDANQTLETIHSFVWQQVEKRLLEK